MGRIRTIKPEFPQSESMGRISREARLLFVLLWTVVDDSGRTRANSRMLASLLYPYDADAPNLIGGWLDELEDQECIVRYTHEGSTYAAICNWLNHQKIDRPSKSKFPSPEEGVARIREDSSNSRESSTTDQGPRTKDQGEDHKAPARKIAQAPFEPPSWVPLEPWMAWMEVRKKKRAAQTPHALALAVKELEKLRLAGNDPGEVLNQSTLRSWTGLFEVRRNGVSSQPVTIYANRKEPLCQ